MEITPKGLAALTGGSVEGDENAVITGFAKIEDANRETSHLLQIPNMPTTFTPHTPRQCW